MRAFKRPGGFAELSDEDRKVLAAAGLPPGSKVWTRRDFPRACREFILLSYLCGSTFYSHLPYCRIQTSCHCHCQAQEAFSRFFKRGAGGDLSEEDKSQLASAGFDINDPQVRLPRVHLSKACPHTRTSPSISQFKSFFHH